MDIPSSPFQPTINIPTPPEMQPSFSIPNSNPPPQKSKTPIIIGAAIGCILLLIIVTSVAIIVLLPYLQKISKSPEGSDIATQIQGKINGGDKLASELAVDTDSDLIPDSIETTLGYNPNISEFTRCQSNGCNKSDLSQAEKSNILLIIDSSGSMGLTSNGQIKMDEAKTAIRNFVTKSGDSSNIGLMVYGQKGSNSESSKALSCSSADIIASIGSVRSSTIESYLSQIKPTGWTPIGLAIQKGEAAFTDKIGQKNQIVIISDGEETCDTNPEKEAASAFSSPAKIQVNVIGLAVSDTDQISLNSISTNGGGTFLYADTAENLSSQLDATYANYSKYSKDIDCIQNSTDTEYNCLHDVFTKTNDYLFAQMDLYAKDEAKYQLYSQLEDKFFNEYQNRINTVSNQGANQLEERKKTLLGE